MKCKHPPIHQWLTWQWPYFKIGPYWDSFAVMADQFSDGQQRATCELRTVPPVPRWLSLALAPVTRSAQTFSKAFTWAEFTAIPKSTIHWLADKSQPPLHTYTFHLGESWWYVYDAGDDADDADDNHGTSTSLWIEPSTSDVSNSRPAMLEMMGRPAKGASRGPGL